jgi:thiol-disulfide isomerase/thioredoxin
MTTSKTFSAISVLLFAFVFLPFTGIAQSYTISGKITGLADTTIYLANYYGNKLYYNDTSRVDSKGMYSFKGKPFNECGKYALVLPGSKVIEFIAAEEPIVIDCSADADIGKIAVRKSENNRLFYEFVRYINDKRKLREPIDVCLADSLKSDADKESCRSALKKLNDEVIAYQKNLIARNPDLLISKFIRMSMEVETPEAPAELSGDEAAKWKYYWYRTHYWDNCDLTDPRLVRDQQFHRLVDTYINRTLPMIPDTICVEAKKLIDRTGNNEDAFKYIVHFITYFSETSKVMCMDRVFVYMVDNYYAKGRATWMKEDKITEMKKSADEKRYCLCGEIAPDIILPDMTGEKWVSMKKSAGKYTLLVIWESTCGHCKKEIPKLLDLYHKWKDKGLVVYAIGNDLENDKWIKFVQENNLDWINVSDTPEIMKQDSASKLIWGGITTLQSLNYRTTWDVNSTPKVYLMDKDMKIIAKQLSAEQLDELIQRMESGEKVNMENMQSHEYEDEDEAPKQPGKSQMKLRNSQPPKPKQ